VTTFLGACLLAFAGWIALGTVSVVFKTRPSAPTLITVLIAAFAIYVLTASALKLHGIA
jgi:hypothetical protein